MSRYIDDEVSVDGGSDGEHDVEDGESQASDGMRNFVVDSDEDDERGAEEPTHGRTEEGFATRGEEDQDAGSAVLQQRSIAERPLGTADNESTGEDLDVQTLDTRDLIAALEIQYEYWTGEFDPHESIHWASERMEVALEDMTLEDVQNQRRNKLHALYYLYNACVERGLLDENTQEGLEWKRKFAALKKMIHWSASLLSCIEYARLTGNGDNVIPPSELNPFPVSCETPEDADVSDFHKVLVFVLQECQRDNLRKFNGDIYAQIVTTDGHYTHAWKRLCSIKQFIYQRIDKETRYEQWLIISNSMNTVDRLTKWLEESDEKELPPLKPDRYCFSFLNGVYNVKNDVFYTYGHPGLTPDIVSCRFIPHMMLQETTDSALYREQPHRIPTPAFDKIFAAQNLDDDVVMWVMALLGRMLYRLQEKDNWQTILFIQGKAGNGKSTIASAIASIYDPTCVGTLNSNCERQWALSSIYDKFIWICLEVKKNFNLDQGSLQSIISGESTVVNKKNATPFSVQWDVPGLLVGNEYPQSWVDVHGALLRRIQMVRFTKLPGKTDPNLMHNLQCELPQLIVKLNRIYLSAVEKCQGEDLRAHLPAYFNETRNQLAAQAQPMRAMLVGDSGIVKRGRDRYIMLDDIKQIYNDFCKLNNIPSQRFNEDSFVDVCEELGLDLLNVTEGIEYNGQVVAAKFVFGIGYPDGGYQAGIRDRMLEMYAGAPSSDQQATRSAARQVQYTDESEEEISNDRRRRSERPNRNTRGGRGARTSTKRRRRGTATSATDGSFSEYTAQLTANDEALLDDGF